MSSDTVHSGPSEKQAQAPASVLVQIARSRQLNARAYQLIRAGDLAGAAAAAEEAVGYARALVQLDRVQFLPQLAKNLGTLSGISARLHQESDAYFAGLECIQHWRTLADLDRLNFGLELADALTRVAPLVHKFVNQREFYTMREEAVVQILRLASLDKAKYQLRAADGALRMADLCAVAGEGAKAIHYSTIAIDLWRELAKENVAEHGAKLAKALRMLAIEQIPVGDPDPVLLREARRIELASRLARVRRNVVQAFLLVCRSPLSLLARVRAGTSR